MRGIRRDAWDMSFHLVVAATFSVFHWGMCKAKTSWQTSWHNSNILVPLSFPNSHNTVLAARDTRILRSASTLLRRSSMLRQGGTLAQHHLLVAAFHCG